MKQVEGFNIVHIERLHKGQFFFFPKGKKRMVADNVRVGITHTTVAATTPTGRAITKDIMNCTPIYVYK